MNNLKRLAVISLILTTLGLMSACGTVRGIGHDVSSTGHAIQRAAS